LGTEQMRRSLPEASAFLFSCELSNC
jgi:hypothetical protein